MPFRLSAGAAAAAAYTAAAYTAAPPLPGPATLTIDLAHVAVAGLGHAGDFAHQFQRAILDREKN